MPTDGTTSPRTKALTVAVLLLTTIGLTGCFDGLYPTSNYSQPCSDGTAELGYFCLLDRNTFTYHYATSIPSSAKPNIRLGLDQYELAVTGVHLNPTYTASPIYSAAQETDIIFRGRAMGTRILGRAWCQDAADRYRCDQYYVDFSTSVAIRRSTACHEVGHAAGLVHGAQASPKQADTNELLGCMRTPASLDAYRYLGAFERDQLNGHY